MNKKGFTLIEGLMVIAIIGVILLTLIPSVIVIINKNKQKSFESTRDSIIAAAKMYVAENKYDNTIIPIDCNGKEEVYIDVPLDKLSGYGNLSTIPEGFPDIEIKFDCQKKIFDYTYGKSNESGEEHSLYNSLTLDDVKENSSSNSNNSDNTISEDTKIFYNVIVKKNINGVESTNAITEEVEKGGQTSEIVIDPKVSYVYPNRIECNSGNATMRPVYFESAALYKANVTVSDVTSNIECIVYFED